MNRKHAALVVWLYVMLMLGSCASAPRASVAQIGRARAAGKTGGAYDVWVQGGYAYIGGNEGVSVFDLRRPNRPTRVAALTLEDESFGLWGQESLLYRVGGRPGLVIADVGTPGEPKTLGTYSGITADSICVENGVAYVAQLQGELSILDVRDPAHPALLATYSGNGMGLSVGYYQGVVYYACSQDGLDVVDVSDPTAPTLLKTMHDMDGAHDIQILGDRLFLACYSQGARILDISDPRSPRVVASFAQGGEAWGISAADGIVCIADLQEGVEFYDIQDAGRPKLIAESSRYAPHDVFYDGRYAYLADQDKGLVILELQNSQ
jgi:hypothetical protein